MKIIIIIIEMKKIYIFVLQNGWATDQLYCEKFLYCNVGKSIARNKEEGNGIVLLGGCWLGKLYCNTVGGLRYIAA